MNGERGLGDERPALEIDEPLPLLHDVAFLEVETLDLADHVGADVHLHAWVDLAAAL